VEFLQRVKMLSPRTARLMISGQSDVQMMTEAINKGEVFRFLSKGMGEARLRAEVREAIQSRARAAHESQPVAAGTTSK
jgi:FixJ family two-component response regulator